MPNSFNTRLKDVCEKKQSRLCIGLDIDPEKLPKSAGNTIFGWEEFTRGIVDATIDLCPVYKLNMAFYECYGAQGFQWMENVVHHIGNRAITIADGKRGDIGNTARKYADSIFGYFGFDAVTVSPYMGRDSILPFLGNESKGVFILCLTSNSSAADFQSLKSDGNTLYQSVAETAMELNKNDNVGLVIGATKVEQMDEISEISNGLSWLVPGVGAQGGDLETSLRKSNTSGTGIINISRGVLYAGDGSISAIRTAAESYTEKMQELL